MQKTKNRLFYFLLVTCFTYVLSQTTFASDSISIGVVGPMSDSNGREVWNGAIMAAEEINRRGGVRVGRKRMPIKLVKANTNEISNVGYAANAMEMLFFHNRVDFVVGGFRSEAVMVMQEVAMDHQKLFISIGAAMPELCQRVAQNYDRYKYYFRGGSPNSYYLAKGSFLQLNYVAQELRKQVGLKRVKVAIAAERSGWVDEMILSSKKAFPKMELELVGVFRPSALATDVHSEINAIAKTGASIVFTLFSTNAGTSFVTQAADALLPAVLVGVNVDVQRDDFWESTNGKANYVVSTAAYCPGVEINRLTKPFVSNYIARFGEIPTVSSESYSTIAFILVPAIEQAGTLDSDILVKIIENKEHTTPLGNITYEKDLMGRPLHDIMFGADHLLFIGIQWVNGKMKGIWPNGYVEVPGAQPLTLKGIVNLKIPPMVLNTHRLQ